ncbi:FecR domain-containing protein [Luteolibacter pohnpeiensis]|uniref:FecR domain-containing protein n=2 Tax=Luteolibacter pohnpeiensis TaxID=454153 RepID=A0A934SAU0_9BACT|nr:FecR domain-containing protein [Luteolibacter pohnpeiensis]
MLSVGYASAQDAPAKLSFPSTAAFVGTYIDSNVGEVSDSSSISVISANSFTAANTTGTYSYTKTGASKATLSYTSVWSSGDDSETEHNTVLLTFTSAGGGTYTSSGSYTGVQDDFNYSGSFTGSGTFTYDFENTAPTISAILDEVIQIGETTGEIDFSIADEESEASDLVVTVDSSNLELVPLDHITTGGSDENRMVSITPVANRSGISTITVTVSDGELTDSTTFQLTVKIGEISYISGANHMISRGGSSSQASLGDPVFTNDTVITGATGLLRIQFVDGSVVTVSPSSSMVVEMFEPVTEGYFDTMINLLKGLLNSAVTSRDGWSFGIRTKNASIGVRGTNFDVSYEDDGSVGSTVVTVSSGVVEVTDLMKDEVSTLTGDQTITIESSTLLSSPSIVGSWTFDNGAGGACLTFLPNGEFTYFEDGDSVENPGGQDGVERGTYSWNSDAGTLEVNVTLDTCGDWGFSSGVGTVSGISTVVSETSLNLESADGESYGFSRISTGDTSLTGAWFRMDNELMTVVSIESDGTYYLVQDDDVELNPGGQDGGEKGTISWNESTGLITSTVLNDTNGGWGLSDLGENPTLVLGDDGNSFVFSDDETEPVTFYRVRPFDGTFESWLTVQSLFGAQAAPHAAPFADGLPNLVRYAMNLSKEPSSADLPSFRVETIDDTPYLTLEFRVRKFLGDVTLVPMLSVDTLEDWQEVPSEYVEDLADADSETLRKMVRVPASSSRVFLQLVASE